jgi:hypothetical protein
MRRGDLAADPTPDASATKGWVADPARRRRCKFLQIAVSHRGVFLRQRRARRCNTAPVKGASMCRGCVRRGDRNGGIDMNAPWQDMTLTGNDLLLAELTHRINNELTSAICIISRAAAK